MKLKERTAEEIGSSGKLQPNFGDEHKSHKISPQTSFPSFFRLCVVQKRGGDIEEKCVEELGALLMS